MSLLQPAQPQSIMLTARTKPGPGNRRARLGVDAAIYDLDLSTGSRALINAHHRGVVVRAVAESDIIDPVSLKIPALEQAGIAVIGDRRASLMHNKFIVIDRLEVWSGSMNFTANDAYRNGNYLLCLRSAQLAEDYTVEFDDLFVYGLFGGDNRPATPYPHVTMNGAESEAYFSPDDGVAEQILREINGAQGNIYFLAYSFPADPVAEAMLARAEAGITVTAVFEKTVCCLKRQPRLRSAVLCRTGCQPTEYA